VIPSLLLTAALALVAPTQNPEPMRGSTGEASAPTQRTTPEGNLARKVGLKLAFEAPQMHVVGQPFEVRVTINAPPEGAAVSTWLLSPGAFTIDGSPVAKRSDETFVQLPGGAELKLTFDLGPFLKVSQPFELGFAKGVYAEGPIGVRVLRPVTGAVNFLDMTAERLAQHMVMLKTTRGDMLIEVWPDVAIEHVRNFLDLANSGFYADTLFHRVIPGFMIQGGDPLTRDPARITEWGTGNGPRMLPAEFSDRKHVRGVLSAARRGSPGVPGPRDPLKNTASCQFFICHTDASSLDGNYTAFGKVLTGLEVIDAIVASPRDAQDRPREPQRILSMSVLSTSLEAPAGAEGGAQGSR